ncbi:bifunctional diguanylate cyclase/phosphodiesterase [Massilia litorea]|uniref:EAL domain-containing protein n=1 Tax=Massilia litorea TaxID=2769491 RepID=A0A7L9U5M1_9BURK|nr:EAL domain-containing protein [Massilia litorea]QOL50288.1 EAL domain-containing protein [Massilia litorea]
MSMSPGAHDHTIPAELENTCALEAIHLLGTVQSYGFVMVVDLASRCIVQVSTGIVKHWPGLQDAAALISRPLSDCVAAVDGSDALDIDALSAAHLVALPWRPRFEQADLPEQPAALHWECLGHRWGQFAVLEWLPANGNGDEQRRQNQIFAGFGEVIARLRRAEGLDAFFRACVKVIQEVSAFDRVMIYRFMPDGCGEVVAEHTSKEYQQKYLGLRFPASDIPSQARTLYLTNKLRLLADVEAPMDGLVPPRLPTGELLDQSHCILRGLSDVHLVYLRNMGVRATMTLSIVCDGKLWGLIACHHHQPRTPPYQIRENMRQIAELLAEIANMRIEALSHLETVRHRLTLDHLLNQFHQALLQDGDITNELELWLPELLPAFDASSLGVQIGTLAFIGGPARRQGATHQILDEVGARLDLQDPRPQVFIWDDLLTSRKRSLLYLPDAAGLLLAQRHDEDIIFCFLTREEVVQQVRWGGEPVKDVVALPNGRIRLEPRRSFAVWQQSVKGHSDPWLQADGEALQNLLRILSEVNKLQVNRKMQETLHWRAHHDHLTGLYNRRAMEDEVARRLDDGQYNTALMLLDLDHFKKINDTYGHETGDLVLQQLSLRLKAVMRENDLLARLGGDEFMLLLQIPHPSAATALTFAERLHGAVSGPFDIKGQQFRLGISVGIAIPPGHGRTVSELLRHADLTLYQAKSLGRCRSIVFELAMAADQREYYLLERDLDEAVERNQLSLVFQPKVDLISRKVVGLEALVRWNHPTRGQNSPSAFIPIAEHSDQIIRIDRWVMRSAIAELARLRSQGLARLPIAINLSIADILSPNLVAYLTELLDEYKVPASALEIEVTESCFMRQLDETQSVLRALNETGISTALDDFGTGFSSLSYLRQLPLQCLKIDQSFTRSMLQDANAEKLTQAIVAMGIALRMTIVAEGVETREQMNWLLAHGCHIGQGYYFSPPVPAQDVQQVIERLEIRLSA